MHLPHSSAVGRFLPACLWILLGRLFQQPHSPRVPPGCRQALPSTKCWCRVLWIRLLKSVCTGILRLLITDSSECRVSDSTATSPEERGKEKVAPWASCSPCLSTQEGQALHTFLTPSVQINMPFLFFPSFYCILVIVSQYSFSQEGLKKTIWGHALLYIHLLSPPLSIIKLNLL